MSPLYLLNITIMKLNSLHKILLVFCLFLFSFVNNTKAQAPCVFPPPIFSEDTNKVSTTVICNSNPLTLWTTSLADCPTCTYEWSDGNTGPFTFAFTPGVYSVTVTDNAPGGCVGVSTTLDIKSSTLPPPLLQGDSFNICNLTDSAVLLVTNLCVGCTYGWFKGANDSISVDTLVSRYATVIPDRYYVKVTDSLGCVEPSNIVVVGATTASIPPLSATALSICDSNTTTLSTVDCAGCSYEWHYYDAPDSAKLMIVGVFDGNVSGGQPKGIALYAIGNIPDLGAYSVDRASNGGSSAGGVAPLPLANVALSSGSYLYIAQNGPQFTNFFGFAPDYVSNVAQLDGNEVIELYYNGGGGPSLVDVFGDTTGVASSTDYSASWTHQDGWAYSDNNRIPNPSFNVANWIINANGLDSCLTNSTATASCTVGPTSGCCEPYPFQVFTPAVGANQQVIPVADTSFYLTNVVGYYSVQVTYPNGCIMESDSILIDTSLFNPQISYQMPNIVGGSVNIVLPSDTAYLCKYSYVDLNTVAPFLSPPTWAYQWYLNGNPIIGATGYNHRTDTTGLFTVEVTNSDGCISMSNVITVLEPTNPGISDPFVSSNSYYLCLGGPSITLSTAPCSDCNYEWRTEDNIGLSGSNASSWVVTNSAGNARGYFVIKTDSLTGCAYSSPIIEIKDTTYTAPLLSTGGDVVCSADPIILSVPACANCTYVWLSEAIDTTTGVDTVLTIQNTYQIDTAGKYRVFIEFNNSGCTSDISNTIPATFQTVNATISTPPLTSICTIDGVKQTVDIAALPSDTSCPTCSYVFLRDSVAMQILVPYDTQTINIGGSYQVVVTNAENCADTSTAVTFTDVSLSTSIRQSAGMICSPTAEVLLEIDPCVGCAYQWYLGGTALISNQDTFLTAIGYAAKGPYTVDITKLGCTAQDSIYLDSVAELTIFIEIDSSASTSPTICNGSSVYLLDTCANCITNNDYTYQWFYANGDTITGASFESYQVDTPATYYVEVLDSNNCAAISNQITVQEFSEPLGFTLDFSPLGPAVPITFGTFNMDTFLMPTSLHPIVNGYSSLTAGAAISGDFLNVGTAGSGYHFITFTYTESNAQGSCTFSTSDTLEVLGAVDMQVTNLDTLAPAFEACLFDSLTITVTNFVFIPDTVIFVAGGGNTIPVPVSPSLTVFAGVYSGSFDIQVPDGARTGKLTLTGSGSSYESSNFFVVQNPAVTIDLIGATQPVCSNLDTVEFNGLPVDGAFSTHYIGQLDDPSLMLDSLLLLENITGYSSGVQNVMMMYTYNPGYTGYPGSCPAIQDSLLVEIRDAELDRVLYTPIAISQVSEAMSNLTLITEPVSARDYTNSYTGTYVIANTLLPSTIATGPGPDSITYEINNGGCINSSTDAVDIWPAPSIMDSIPNYLCSAEDTVFIQRDVDSLWLTYRGQVIYSDTLYKYSSNLNVPFPSFSNVDVRYSEYINLMEITSSNGGLTAINSLPPNEVYHFIPGNVTGGSTALNFKFKYSRTATFFDAGGAVLSVENTDYTIAEVQKNILIEDPSLVAINAVILADTIFCPINANNVFLGQPAGGQYYISSWTVPGMAYDSIQDNIFNPTNYLTDSSYKLTYVYIGQACEDSASTGIFLPSPFNIAVQPNNGTGDYCETSPNDSIFFSLLPPNFTQQIDTSSAQFFISGVQSSTIFSPAQVGPPGDYNVRYVVNDIYGCPAEALDVFRVFPIPNLATSTINPLYCANEDTVQVHLYQIDSNNVYNELTTFFGGTGIGYIQNENVTLTGTGILAGGNNPATPYFSPVVAGVGVHGLSYVYVDSNSCADSVNITVEILELPIVSMATTGGTPILPYYCENDSIPLFGTPIGTFFQSGYGTDTSVLTGNPLINAPYPSSLDSINKAFKPNVPGTAPGILQEIIYYYYIDNNGCSDTARYPINIRNFTTDPTITGLPAVTCASDLEIPIMGTPNPTGLDLSNYGWFTVDAFYQNGFSQLGPSVYTDSIIFYPDSTGIEYAGRNLEVTFHYTDTSRSCFNNVKDTVWVNALPHLSLSESLASIDPPGSKLIVPPTDTFYHVCETEPEIPVFAFNTTGLYNPFTDSISFPITGPDHISPDTGIYSISIGMVPNTSGGGNISYGYRSSISGPGLDTIRYAYTDANGCVDSIDHYMFVDSLPVLAFAGLSNYNAGLDRYVYCETEPNPPLILPFPTGVDGQLTFNGQVLPYSIPFQLRPDTLAVTGVYTDYILNYTYVGQQYVSGGVCSDSISDTIQIRPSPQLAWVNVPEHYCIVDSMERLPLSATPLGGTFIDQTFGVTAGIVSDTLFDPSAQPGKRDIVYYYLDPISGCDDTIQRTIFVYTKPQINFDISGGCSGLQVDFIPTTAPYGLEYNGVAIDSITQVIWNYGDGVIDTFSNLPDTLVIPTATHTYVGSGIFYPSLTVVNQGICDTVFTRRIVVSPTAIPTDSLPYTENFDTPGGWMQEAADTSSLDGIIQDSLWQWGVAIGSNINTAAAGNLVWGTRLMTQPITYKQGENAWVYSPCFDMTNLERPMIEMSIWRNSQNHVDGTVLQYYDNVSNSWKVLGEHGKGINWYQDGFVVSSPGNQTNTPVGWTGTTIGWENVRYRLDNIGSDLRSRTDVRFRMAFASSPSTLLNVNEGIAFDSVKIGNRTRNVLTEHFSGVGYPYIETIEDNLYHTIYNNLYGRDVTLIQYHTNYYSNDAFYLFNQADVNSHKWTYSITDANQVRIDGKDLVSSTSDLLNYPQLEYLDIEALADPKFDLKFHGFPNIIINNGVLTTDIVVEAMQDLPSAEYTLRVVITEDSLQTVVNNHITTAVMRAMLPDYAGTRYSQPWATGTTDTLSITWPYSTTTHPNAARLGVTAFMQNVSTKEVYQVISSRDLTIFIGGVDTLDVSVDQIEDKPGYEVVNMKLYPNPAQDLFNVAFDKELDGDYEWQLIDAVGRVLKYGKVQHGTSRMEVETRELTSGMYIFTMKNENVYTQRKVIIRKP